MKCPHCDKESKAKVLESRKVNGEVWRNRFCNKCLKQFVSHETTSADLKFPWTALNRRKKLKQAEEKPVQQQNKWVFPTKLW